MALCPSLTIFVRGHQLVDLLVGPRSQDLNEALLIGPNALGGKKGHVSSSLRWEATIPELGTWGGQELGNPQHSGCS